MLKAFKVTFPVLLGYLPLGIAFGLLAVQSGLHWYTAVLMSIFIFSGATQFLFISLLMARSGLAQFAVISLLLGMRHVFYGITMLRKYKGTGLYKPYLIFGLTDETYALVLNAKNQEHREKYFFSITLLNHLYWVCGTLAGALLGFALDLKIRGLEFSLVALFVVLAIEQYKNARDRMLVFAAIIAGVISMLLVPKNSMLLAAVFLCSIYALFHRRHNNE